MAALLIPGLAFLSALVLVALANTANVQTKAQTESQQTFWGFIGDALTGKTVVHQITQATRSAVSRWALAQLKPVTAWFIALNVLLLNVFRTQAQVADETATALETTNRRIRTSTTYKDGTSVKTKASTASSTATKAKTTAHTTSTSLHNYRVATRPKIAHVTRAVDVTIPGRFERVKTREDKLSSDAKALRERTTSLENGAVKAFEWIRSHPFSAVTGVFAGAVAIALTRLGYGFLRCRSWRNVGRGLTCGMGSLLADLLALAIDVLVVADICQITQKMISVAESSVVQTALRGIVDGTEELMLCQGVKAPPALAGYWTEPPPLQTFSALPA